MSMKRRTFLKSAMTGSALLAYSNPGQLAAMQNWNLQHNSIPKKTSFLKTFTAKDEVFIKTIQSAFHAKGKSAIPIVELAVKTQLDPAMLEQNLSDLAGSRLIGLMEDTPFSIFQSLLLTHNARFSLIGHHSWDLDQLHKSHHHFLSVPQSQGVSASLAAALSSPEQSYYISETNLSAAPKMVSRSPVSTTQHAQWSTAMAELLADIATGEWQAAEAGEFQHRTQQNDYGKRGSLTSFVVDI